MNERADIWQICVAAFLGCLFAAVLTDVIVTTSFALSYGLDATLIGAGIVGLFIGMIVALVTALPLGCLIGWLVSLVGSNSRLKGAITGALTGLILMGAAINCNAVPSPGFDLVALLYFPGFALCGAISGWMAHAMAFDRPLAPQG